MVILAAGSKKPRSLALENIDLPGVMYAVDYLSEATRAVVSGKKPSVSAKNRNVVIVGGGDTGNDCVGTALRQHARSVIQLEMTPMPPLERTPDNPWPEWPRTAKFDYGQQEAAAVFGKDPRIFSTTVSRLIEKNGRLHEIEIVSLDSHFKPIPGSEQLLRCDLLLIAAGFVGIEDSLKESFSLQTTPRNTIVTRDASYQTADPKVFACGDCKRGQSLVVWAMEQGKQCAKEVDRYLMGYTNIE